jgi:O-antigen ligase
VLRSLNLEKIYQNLLILMAFLMPLTVSGANIVIAIICFIWLFSGSYKSKYKQITSNKLMIASLLFYFWHVIGLLWTEDIEWGFHILHKMWYFLLFFPILYNIVQRKYIKYYLISFLMAIALTEIISYLIWFELIDPFKNATIENPTPFMSHISYNPILAFAIYLVLHEFVFNKKLSNLKFSFYGFFAFSMSVNMFITGGRAGQIVFFVMLSILIFQFFDRERVKSIITIFILIPLIFIFSYTASDLFKERVDGAIYETMHFDSQNHDQETSLGLRYRYTLNSWEVIKKNLIIGIGTGDFPSEYLKINQIMTPGLPNTSNPHNMYTLVLMQLGLIGLISMLSIFYYQIRLSLNSPNKFIRDAGITLPLMFLVLMLSDTYLLGHYTTLLFVFFSSFLYKDFDKS